jgi:hypothetical protein
MKRELLYRNKIDLFIRYSVLSDEAARKGGAAKK